MDNKDVLMDAFGRIRGVVSATVSGLSAEDLAWRAGQDANSIGWLVWHLSRIQDDHIAEVAGTEQVWVSDDWVSRLALPFATEDTGFGHTTQDVAAVQVSSPDLLSGYHEAVHAQTERYLRGLSDNDLDAVVDASWNPPVTLGVRLVSVIADGLQHAGQAAFVRGLLS